MDAAGRPTLHIFTDTAIPVDIRLNQGELTSRYRYVTDANGNTTTSQVEDKVVLDVTVLFGKDGTIKLNFRGDTGTTFQGTFSPTGAGPTGVEKFNFNLRRLSLTYSPFAGMDVAFHDLELSAGSMGTEKGSGTEDTYFDDDGWVMGYRAKVSVSPKGYLAVTGGYVGDLRTPNVFDRLSRLGEYNYLQVLLNHSIGAIAVASFDYTQWQNNDYARGAIRIDLGQWTKLIDSLTIEDMTRIGSNSSTPQDIATVFAVKITKRFKALLPGDRDLALTLAYIYNDRTMNWPFADKVIVGNQVRFQVSIPNLLKLKFGNLSWFINYIQSLDSLERFRIDSGLSLVF
jgi:hypothetical protein